MKQQDKIKNDIIGIRYGRLTVISYSHKEKRKSSGYNHYYNCLCDCGNKCIAERNSLGRTKNSCGCLHSEILKNKNKQNAKYNGDSKNEYKRLYQSLFEGNRKGIA